MLLVNNGYLWLIVFSAEQTSFDLWNDLSETLQPGQYTIPFSIQLPQVYQLSALHSVKIDALVVVVFA